MSPKPRSSRREIEVQEERLKRMAERLRQNRCPEIRAIAEDILADLKEPVFELPN